jgi:hypothetical protein
MVALSSCEAEYIAGTVAACQGVWLARLLEEVTGRKTAAPRIKIDNMSVIALSKNPILHTRSKHIKTRYHFIRECVESGEFGLEFVGMNDQIADILTKPRGRIHFQDLCSQIGVNQLSSKKLLK